MKRSHAAALTSIVGVGLALRVAFALHLRFHIDEPASVLAFQRVAHTSWPIFPSGVLYLQGATLSYLSAPLTWLGLDTPEHPGWVRLVPILAGTASIGMAWRLARSLGPWIALLAALAVALDPVAVQWSAHLRPYSLLQLITLAIAWRTTELLHTRTGDTVLLPVLFLLGSLTHLLVALLLPGMLLAALWIHGRSLLSDRRDLLFTGIACALGPLFVVALNRWFTVTSAATEDAAGAVSFVGNHLLDPSKLFAPTLYAWGNLLDRYGWAELALFLLLVPAGGLLWKRWRAVIPTDDPRLVWAVLATVGITLVAFLSPTHQQRYVLHLHTLALLGSLGSLVLLPRWLGGSLLMLLWVGQGLGLSTTWKTAPRTVDYRPLHAHLQRLQVPGEPIVTPMPALTAWFAPERAADIVFLAGAEDSPRPQRYTHTGSDGLPRDFWLGAPSLTTSTAFCSFLEANPRAWVLWDVRRTRTEDVFKGRMSELLRRLSVRAKGSNGARLGRLRERDGSPCGTGTDRDLR